MNLNIELHHTPLNITECNQWVSGAASGGINIFIGTVRDNTKGRKVKYLEYEAYDPMAIAEMKKLAQSAHQKWNEINSILIHHRLGHLAIGEAAVIIAVAAPHRQVTFEVCQYLIDTLKQTVPIWKKEFFEDGESWVSAFP